MPWCFAIPSIHPGRLGGGRRGWTSCHTADPWTPALAPMFAFCNGGVVGGRPSEVQSSGQATEELVFRTSRIDAPRRRRAVLARLLPVAPLQMTTAPVYTPLDGPRRLASGAYDHGLKLPRLDAPTDSNLTSSQGATYLYCPAVVTTVRPICRPARLPPVGDRVYFHQPPCLPDNNQTGLFLLGRSAHGNEQEVGASKTVCAIATLRPVTAW